MKIFKKDPFGYNIFVKDLLIKTLGLLSYRRFRGINNLKISGSEIIKKLPKTHFFYHSSLITFKKILNYE